jgi:hypothetical protein
MILELPGAGSPVQITFDHTRPVEGGSYGPRNSKVIDARDMPRTLRFEHRLHLSTLVLTAARDVAIG